MASGMAMRDLDRGDGCARRGRSCRVLAAVWLATALPIAAIAAPPPPMPPAPTDPYDVFSASDMVAVTPASAIVVPAPVRIAAARPVVAAPLLAPAAPPIPTLITATAPRLLPAPVADPLRIDLAADPVLALGRSDGSADLFRMMIAQAVQAAPASLEARAEGQVAVAARGQARSALFPTIDLGATGYRTLARDFTSDPNTIVERSRGQGRTDATLNVQQTVVDFGATSIRIAAAGGRLRAAAAAIDATADQVALRAIATWYDLFVARALVRLSAGFAETQADLRRAIAVRVSEGVAAQGDVARVDSFVAGANVRAAGYARAQADAEARFAQLLRLPAPDRLVRAPILDARAISRDYAAFAALATPAVLSVGAQADAARDDARAARRDLLPTVVAGVQAGRYGFLEDLPAYDVRGVLTVRQRFLGGTGARVDQVRAQAGVAEARAMRAREEAARDGAIAWSDVAALTAQLAAFEEAYVAARRSRDVLVERFRHTRGTLFDVLAAQDAFFLAATAYVQGLGELDAARYVLLSRTGRLLPAIGISTAQGTLR